MNEDRYLQAAMRTADWIASLAVERDGGITWPHKPGGQLMSTGLYSEADGVLWFLTQAYATTREPRFVEVGRKAAHFVAAAMPSADRCGLYTGVAGTGAALHRFAEAAGDEDALQGARRAIDLVQDRAERSTEGLHWHGFNELIWGTAGIALFLLDVGGALGDDGAIEDAVRAGEWLLSRAEPAADRLKWDVGPAANFEYVSPSMSHGVSGIGYVLVELHERTGRSDFLDAAIAGAGYVCSAGRPDDEGFAPYHSEPKLTDEFHLGWCHGPTGVASFFERLFQATGDAQWRHLVLRCAHTVRTSGLPHRRYPGFWDNVGRCCGSAGVIEFFGGLCVRTGDPSHLEFAREVADDLLERAHTDESGMRWSNVEHRRDPPELPPYVDLMQGAAGIGISLLRLHGILTGEDRPVRFPHSPWEA